MAVVALVSDLIFGSKITGTAQHLGVQADVVRTPEDVLRLAPEATGVIVDMNAPTGDVLELLRRLRAQRPELPIVAFLAHVQVELAREARATGVSEVLPRSKFTADLPDILRRLSERPNPESASVD